MSARVARLYVISMFLLASVIAVSLFFVIRNCFEPKAGEITFSVKLGGFTDSKQVVNGYTFDENGNHTNLSFYAIPGELVNVVVPIRSNTESVYIFAPVNSMVCEVSWSDGGEVIESYSQFDVWNDLELPKCDWRRHYSSDGERRS